MSPSVSVCMPMYNASCYLRECIESVLAQTFTDYEFIIIDDGSTDDSVTVARSYSDRRIRVIECAHDYIGTLNRLIDEAKGKYLARMDADDVMMPYRLQEQYDYMEQHPEVDVWAGAMTIVGEEGAAIEPPVKGRPLEIKDFLPNNLFGNPATIVRTATLRRLGVRYEEDFKYAEDYRFWASLVHAGAIVLCTDRVFFKFRRSSGQTTITHNAEAWAANARVKEEMEHWITDKYWAQYEHPEIKDTGKKLTVIIPFLNEGEEIVNTVQSVRDTVGNAVDVVVINDQSTDEYPYKEKLAAYDVYYILNKDRKGVAASRDYGVSLCRTPYFLLLDGHMRFYQTDWHDRLVMLLEEEDRRLLCCQGRPLEKLDGVVVDCQVEKQNYGAFLPFVKGSLLTDLRWNTRDIYPQRDVYAIPAVLGAGYAASKRYWTYLKGLEGLEMYGSDETYISLKVWLEGGECLLVKDVVAGHIYRKSAPFRRISEVEAYNKLLISYLLFPQSWHSLMMAAVLVENPRSYHYAANRLAREKDRWDERKDYLARIARRPFNQVVRLQQVGMKEEIYERLNVLGRIHDMAEFVLSSQPAGEGICEGRMGIMIWLCRYHRLYGGKRIDTATETLWDDIYDSITRQSLPANFRYGLAGIGWGLVYLYEHGFIENDIGFVLDEIDRQLECVNLAGMAGTDFFLGTAGHVAYAAARIRYACLTKGDMPYGKSRLDVYENAARHILEQPQPMLNEAFQAISFLRLLKYGWDSADMPLSIGSWLPDAWHLPLNSRFWDNKMESAPMTATLRAMILKSNLYRELS